MMQDSGSDSSRFLSEDEIIYEVFLKDLSRGEGEVVGPGDDGAVLDWDGRLVVTVDMLVEGVHFDLSYFSPSNVGFKAVSVNVSDLAAMGAEPRSCFLSIGMPTEVDPGFVRELAEGFRRALEIYGVCLSGGDTVRSERLILSVTILGNPRGNPLVRSGARPGDFIYLSRQTGLSHMGMLLLKEKKESSLRGLASVAVKRHLVPFAELELGLYLAETGAATSCIDVSDGLVKDLNRILSSSGVGAVVRKNSLGIVGGYGELASYLGLDPLEVFLHGGEDFALLFTVPPEREEILSGYRGAAGLMRIGEIREEPGVLLETEDGFEEIGDVGPSSFEHFGRGGE